MRSDKKCNLFSVIAFICMLFSFITYLVMYLPMCEIMSVFNLYLNDTLVFVSFVLSIIGLWKGFKSKDTSYHYTWLSYIVIVISGFRIAYFVYQYIYYKSVIVPYMISE